MTLLYVALFTGLIGFLIGNKKGYGFQGFIAGALLSVIGWIWIASLKPRWRCPDCGGGIEKEFKKCKNCGAEIKQPGDLHKKVEADESSQSTSLQIVKKKPIAGYVFLVLVLAFLLVVYFQRKKISLLDIENTGLNIQSINMNKYLQIRDNMTYLVVVNILGRSGEEQSRNKIDAIPGVMEAIETVMYQWTNKDGTGMNAIFQNNKLFQKAQVGLE